MKSHNLTPTRLRLILSISLVLLVAIGVALFSVGYKQLKSFAISVQTVSDQAEASQSSVQDLIATKTFLENNSVSVYKASQLSAESKKYSYQDQIINDINQYANEAGLVISNISFSNIADPATARAGTAPATGAAPATSAPPSGLKSVTALVTVKNPTNYKAMLNFINLIQQSLFRMQISAVGISGAGDTDQVNSDTLSIEVYIK